MGYGCGFLEGVFERLDGIVGGDEWGMGVNGSERGGLIGVYGGV